MTSNGHSPFLRRLIDALTIKDVAVADHAARAHHAAKYAHLQGFLEDVERDMAPYAEALWRPALDNPELPEGLRSVLMQAIEPTHQVDAIVNFFATMVAVFYGGFSIAPPIMQSAVNLSWRTHQYLPLSPAQAATAAVRGHMSVSDAAAEATLSGLDGDRFLTLYNTTGNAPGPETLMAMLRRNIIDGGAFFRGIAQGLTRTEWADELAALRYGPPSAAQAILGAVQNHLDPAAARTIVAEDGIDPSNYDWLYQNAGRPIAIGQALRLWNRGDITEAAVEQAIRESDIKDKYITAVKALRIYVPPVRTVTAMARSGSINDARATELYHENGVRDADIAGYLAEAHHTKTATAATHHLTQGVIVEGYRNGALARAEALVHLVQLGYVEADATLMLDVADAQVIAQRHTSEVARVRTLYLGRKITRATAAGDLDKLGVQAGARDAMLGEWDVIRVVPTKELTVGQLTQLHKRELLSDAEYGDRLVAIGYTPADADLLVTLATTQLTVAQQQKAFKRGDLTEAQFRERMAVRGIEPVDAGLLVRQTVENTAGVVP